MRRSLDRVLPVIKGIARVCDVPISIDTYKVPVAEAAIDAGASLINDVWGLKKDAALAEVAAKRGTPLILMHNQPEPGYTRLIPDIVASLCRSVATAIEAGVATGADHRRSRVRVREDCFAQPGGPAATWGDKVGVGAAAALGDKSEVNDWASSGPSCG